MGSGQAWIPSYWRRRAPQDVWMCEAPRSPRMPSTPPRRAFICGSDLIKPRFTEVVRRNLQRERQAFLAKAHRKGNRGAARDAVDPVRDAAFAAWIGIELVHRFRRRLPAWADYDVHGCAEQLGIGRAQ